MPIETMRLVLRPFRPVDLLALRESVEAFERSFQVRAAEGLRDFYVSASVSPAWLDRLRHATSTDSWYDGFAIIHRDERLVIGSAGFKGPPDEHGMVEIAYGIVPAWQGKGLATEAAEALVAYAFGSRRVRLVRAHTLPDPNASTRVLTKCGFTRVGEVTDPEDGRVWRWELTKRVKG